MMTWLGFESGGRVLLLAVMLCVTPASVLATGSCPGSGLCCVANGTPGCGTPDCCEMICAVDPFCCDTEWDQICADQAVEQCSVCQPQACCYSTGQCVDTDPLNCVFSFGSPQGDGTTCAKDGCPCPGQGDCCQANGTPGCNDGTCCSQVCDADPFCCDTEWDQICADQANESCGVCNPTPPVACCFEDETCTDMDPISCFWIGGEPQSPGVLCSSNPCVPPVCCDGAEMPEDEACGADANGGCDSQAGFTPATCGDVFCGTAWADGNARDTDWYLVTLDGGGTLTATLESPADCEVYVLGGIDDCLYFLVADSTSGDCAAGVAAATGLKPGSYAILVTPSALNGFPCSGEIIEYRLTIAGDCFLPQACCLPDGSCDELPVDGCTASGGDPQGFGSTCGADGYAELTCASPFEDISGSGIEAPNASNVDDAGDVVPLGFTFEFFGNGHNTIGVCSNGYLTFGDTLSDFTNDVIPAEDEPNDLIAPFWDDWSPNQGGTVHYQTLGPAGDRRFIAQWTNVVNFNTGGLATFQAVLHEDGGCIELRYGQTLEMGTPSVGVENEDGTEGTSIVPASITPGACLTLCPSQPVSCPVVPSCPADTNLDGVVDVTDLVNVVLSWGPCPGGPCPGDVDGSGVVDVGDLVNVILSWGACP